MLAGIPVRIISAIAMSLIADVGIGVLSQAEAEAKAEESDQAEEDFEEGKCPVEIALGMGINVYT